MFARLTATLTLLALACLTMPLHAEEPEAPAKEQPAKKADYSADKQAAENTAEKPAVKKVEKPKPPKPQYEHKDIRIEAASADEPVREAFSAKAAADYVEQGAIAWGKANNCVSCHTNGSYLRIRPALSGVLGKPSEDVRNDFLTELAKFRIIRKKEKQLKKDIRPTITAYMAAGLAEWDAHVTGKLSPETEEALGLMFAAQADDGSWNNQNCWPPIESSAYHAATVAAMATVSAPGWLEKISADQEKNADVIAGLEKMKKYLRETEPPHDYGRLLLLWASTRVDGLIDDEKAAEIREMIFAHQNEDGGWSLRSFAAPEKWGNGGRVGRLEAEDEATRTASDGHQTGLSVLVLRAAGIEATDPRITKAVTWLKNNQRQSGRWWTRSLNTDRVHYITYTGSIYPLAALHACGELGPKGLAGK